MHMLAMIQKHPVIAQYPREYWFLFVGVFINRISASMIWPFLTVYIYQTLEIPLATVTLLLSLRAVFSVISTAIVSPLMDRIGRKGVMIAGLIGSAVVFIGMAYANNLTTWIIMVSAHGVVIPIFNIGVNAMVADLIETDRRAPAYALIRSISNAGIAIGPMIGGYLAIISFQAVFIATGITYIIIAIMTVLILPETNPIQTKEEKLLRAGGYGVIFKDSIFIWFSLFYFIILMAYSNIFSLLPVYLTENFAMNETQYSLAFTVNAVLVVLFQYSVTKITDKYRPFAAITVGTLFYIVGLLSVAFGSVLWHFLVSMAIITIGELIISPTATTLVANMSPDNMRARYMGIFTLGYPIGSGIGPVVGGFMNDTVSPASMWYSSATLAAIAGIGFFTLARIYWSSQAKST